MSKCTSSIIVLLGLLLPAASASAAADIHAVFKLWSSMYGRENTTKTELWIGADRECHLNPKETKIIRKDLGVIWHIQPNAKTYSESPLKPEKDPSTAVPSPQKSEILLPAQKSPNKDLRFVGSYTDEVTYDWSIRSLDDDMVQGISCQVFSIKGDSDFADIKAKIWVSPCGKKAGLAAPEDFLIRLARGNKSLVDHIQKILADFPNGGLLCLEKTSHPSIGPESKAKILLELYETKESPPGIYEIPKGFEKKLGKQS